MKLPPASTKASGTAYDCSSSVVQPKMLPPKQRTLTSRSDRPSLRVCMHLSPEIAPGAVCQTGAWMSERRERHQARAQDREQFGAHGVDRAVAVDAAQEPPRVVVVQDRGRLAHEDVDPPLDDLALIVVALDQWLVALQAAHPLAEVLEIDVVDRLALGADPAAGQPIDQHRGRHVEEEGRVDAAAAQLELA